MLSLALLSGLLAAAAAQNSSSSSSACVTGDAVHMIIARASQEPPGTGTIGQVATQVQAQLPGSDVVAVEYPATLADYTASEAAGVTAMTALATEYAGRCPDSKMVLMGYSQGAQVAADVLCGTDDGDTFNMTQALPEDVARKVSAAVLMGDPSKAMNESFLQGTSTKDGVSLLPRFDDYTPALRGGGGGGSIRTWLTRRQVFPRRSTSKCAALAGRIVSYCNANDTFCDSGSSIQVHISYVENNGTSAVNFIVKQAQSGAGGSGGGNGAGNGQSSTVKSGSGPAGGQAWEVLGLTMTGLSLSLGFLVLA